MLNVHLAGIFQGKTSKSPKISSKVTHLSANPNKLPTALQLQFLRSP